MSKKNSKPQQSKLGGEVVELGNLKVAEKIQLKSEAQLNLQEPHLTLLKGYLNAKLINKKINIGQYFTSIIKGKQVSFTIAKINQKIINQTSEKTQKYELSYVTNGNTLITFKNKKDQKQDIGKNLSSQQIWFYGYTQEVKEIKETITHSLFQREDLINKGLSPIKGILISGFSGAGKSAILKQIKQDFALEYQLVFWKQISSIQMLSRVVGGAEDYIRGVFKELREKSPSVLTIEDLHLLFQAKEVSSHQTVLATLLSEMQSIEKEQIIVVGTYNSDRQLTKSIYSAGKFQKQITLNYPNHTLRLQILEKMTQRLNLRVKIDLEQLKKLNLRLNGFSVGEIKHIIREAINQEGQNLNFVHLQELVKKYRPAEIKELIVEIPEVKWSQIGGYQQVKKQIKKVVELPLQHGDKFLKFGIQASKGILLYGPPGCSKTMMAKAIATQSKLNFIGIKGPQLFSKYVGQSERAIRNIFKRARACCPCVIFFDEIDALATQRAANTEVTDRVLCQLLNEMDGIEGLKEVAIVAATNRPQILDKALMRPGRFDYLIYVGPPNEKARKQILQINLKKSLNMQQVESVSEYIAKKTQNYTGAELALVCSIIGRDKLLENIIKALINGVEKNKTETNFINNYQILAIQMWTQRVIIQFIKNKKNQYLVNRYQDPKIYNSGKTLKLKQFRRQWQNKILQFLQSWNTQKVLQASNQKHHYMQNCQIYRKTLLKDCQHVIRQKGVYHYFFFLQVQLVLSKFKRILQNLCRNQFKMFQISSYFLSGEFDTFFKNHRNSLFVSLMEILTHFPQIQKIRIINYFWFTIQKIQQQQHSQLQLYFKQSQKNNQKIQNVWPATRYCRKCTEYQASTMSRCYYEVVQYSQNDLKISSSRLETPRIPPYQEIHHLRSLFSTLEIAAHSLNKLESVGISIIDAEKHMVALKINLQKDGRASSKELLLIIIKQYSEFRDIQKLSTYFYLSNKQQYYKYKSNKVFHILQIEQIQGYLLTNYSYDDDFNQVSQRYYQCEYDQIYDKMFGLNQRNQSFKNQVIHYRERGYITQKLASVLKEISSIPGHTVKNERGFSRLSAIFSNQRARLSDESIEALYFLRPYFRNYE